LGCQEGEEPERRATYRIVVEGLDIDTTLSFALGNIVNGQTYTFFTYGRVVGTQTEILIGVIDQNNVIVAATTIRLDNTVTLPPTGVTEGGGYVQITPVAGLNAITVPFDWNGAIPSVLVGIDLGIGRMPAIVSWSVSPAPTAVVASALSLTAVLSGAAPDWAGLDVYALSGTPDPGDMRDDLALDPSLPIFVGHTTAAAEPGLTTVRLVVANSRGGISTTSQVIGLLPNTGDWNTLSTAEIIAFLAALPWHGLDAERSELEADYDSNTTLDLAVDLNDDGDLDELRYRDGGGAVVSTLRIVNDPVYNLTSLTDVNGGGIPRVLRDYGQDGNWDEQWLDLNQNGFPEPSEVTPITQSYTVPSVGTFPDPPGPPIGSTPSTPTYNQRPILSYPSQFDTPDGKQLTFLGANSVSVHEPEGQLVYLAMGWDRCAELVEPNPLPAGISAGPWTNAPYPWDEMRSWSGSETAINDLLEQIGWHRYLCTGTQEIGLAANDTTAYLPYMRGIEVTYQENRTPVYPSNLEVTTDVATPITVDLVAQVVDPDNDPMELIWIDPQRSNTVTVPYTSFSHDTSSFTFDPTGLYPGLGRGQINPTEFRFGIWETGRWSAGYITVNVVGLDNPPVAERDFMSADEDQLLVLPAPGVLDNDTDPDLDTLTAVLISGPTQGNLTLNSDGSLEYDQGGAFDYLWENGTRQISFSYAAHDGLSQSAPTQAYITITGSDDPPTITPPIAPITIAEDNPQPLNVPLAFFDPEGEDIRFSLQNAPGWLSVRGPSTGEYLYGRPTDNNDVGTTVVRVIAREMGGLPWNESFQDVTVTVTPTNDPPVLDATGLPRATVDESIPVGTNFGTLQVIDTDQGDSWTYSFVSGNGNNQFRLVPGTASVDVVLDAPLDYETDRNHSLPILVTDSGGLTATHYFSVRVNNVSDEPPVLANVTGTAREDGREDWPLPAVDIENETLTYSEVTPPANGRIEFGMTGGFNPVPEVRYYPAPNYNGPDQFVIRANDGTLDSNDAVYDITVTPVNDWPTANNLNGFVTPEDTPITITLVGDDIDGDPLTYTVVDGPTRAGVSRTSVGSVAIVGDQATFTPNLNFWGDVEFTYRANDGQFDSNVATVELTVDSVNDPPVIGQASYSFTVPENSDSSVTIGTASATDPDGGVWFRIPAGDPAHAYFQFVGWSLKPAAGAILDFERPGGPSFTFPIEAYDSYGATDPGTATVVLTDVNETPVIGTPGPFTVPENSPANTFIGDLNISDPDANQLLTYTVQGWSSTLGSWDAPLMVNQTTGLAIVEVADAAYIGSLSGPVAPLDHETHPNLRLFVRVEDPLGLYAAEYIDVTVTDVDEPPVLVNTGPFDIDENHPAGATVATLNVVDPEGATPIVSIVAGVGSYDLFDIVGDDLVVKSPTILNFETATTHQIELDVSDGALAQRYVLTIDVNNRRDPLVITTPSLSVPENAPAGTSVGQFSASSEDGPVSYSVVFGGYDIDPVNGKLTVVTSANYEQLGTPPNDWVQVTIEGPWLNGGRERDSQTYPIVVSDINEPTSVSRSSFPTVSVVAGGTHAESFTLEDGDRNEPYVLGTLPGWVSTARTASWETNFGTTFYQSDTYEFGGTVPRQPGPISIGIDVADRANPVTTIKQDIYPVYIDVSASTQLAAVGQSVTFTAVAEGMAPYTYSWRVGSSSRAGTNQLTETFSTTGVHTVSVWIVDNNGTRSAAATVDVTVIDATVSDMDCDWDFETATDIECWRIFPRVDFDINTPREVCFALSFDPGSDPRAVSGVDWTFSSNLLVPTYNSPSTTQTAGNTLTQEWCLTPSFAEWDPTTGTAVFLDEFTLTADVTTFGGVQSISRTYRDSAAQHWYRPALRPVGDEGRQSFTTGSGLLASSEWYFSREADTAYVTLYQTSDGISVASPGPNASGIACGLGVDTPIASLTKAQLDNCTLDGLTGDEVLEVVGYSQVPQLARQTSGYLTAEEALDDLGTGFRMVHIDLFGSDEAAQLVEVRAAIGVTNLDYWSNISLGSSDPAVLSNATFGLNRVHYTVLRFDQGARPDWRLVLNSVDYPDAIELVLPNSATDVNSGHDQDLELAQELDLPVLVRTINPHPTLLLKGGIEADAILTDRNWSADITELGEYWRRGGLDHYETISAASGDFDDDGIADFVEIVRFSAAPYTVGDLFNYTDWGSGNFSSLLGRDYNMVRTVRLGGAGPDDVVLMNDDTGVWHTQMGSTTGFGAIGAVWNEPGWFPTLPETAPPGFSAFNGSAISVDLDNDSYEELVMNAQINGEGAVIVIKGSATGIDRATRRIITPADCSVTELGIEFGASLEYENNDLYIGAPNRDAGTVPGGAVFRIEDSSSFFTASLNCDEISNPSPTAAIGDGFGVEMVALDHSYAPGWVIGDASARLYSFSRAGNGSPNAASAVEFSARTPFTPSSVSCSGADYDLYGFDLNRDWEDDLVVSYPCHSETIGATIYNEVGALEVFVNTLDLGLFAADPLVVEFGKEFMSQYPSTPIDTILEPGARFGQVIVGGNFPAGYFHQLTFPTDNWSAPRWGEEIRLYSRPFATTDLAHVLRFNFSAIQ